MCLIACSTYHIISNFQCQVFMLALISDVKAQHCTTASTRPTFSLKEVNVFHTNNNSLRFGSTVFFPQFQCSDNPGVSIQVIVFCMQQLFLLARALLFFICRCISLTPVHISQCFTLQFRANLTFTVCLFLQVIQTAFASVCVLFISTTVCTFFKNLGSYPVIP